VNDCGGFTFFKKKIKKWRKVRFVACWGDGLKDLRVCFIAFVDGRERAFK
jgi:hypothetical protein